MHPDNCEPPFLFLSTFHKRFTILNTIAKPSTHNGVHGRLDKLSGVDVAVNKPVNVGFSVGPEGLPGPFVVMANPGQLLEAEYHTPLMMTPSPLSKLLTASDGQVLLIART